MGFLPMPLLHSVSDDDPPMYAPGCGVGCCFETEILRLLVRATGLEEGGGRGYIYIYIV